jgi:plastocyanin
MDSRFLLAFLAATLWGCCAAASDLKVLVLDPVGRPVADVVVIAKPSIAAAARPDAPERAHAAMDQRNREFVPHILVVQERTWVDFPNNDTVSHQVYSFSPAKRFQLPLYKGRKHPPVLFDQPGIVTLGCNIHDNMLGYIYVADSPHFGKTDIDGRWTGANLPPGRYDVRIWSPRIKEEQESLHRVLDLADPIATEETFRLERKLKSEWKTPTESKSWDDY